MIRISSNKGVPRTPLRGERTARAQALTSATNPLRCFVKSETACCGKVVKKADLAESS